MKNYNNSSCNSLIELNQNIFNENNEIETYIIDKKNDFEEKFQYIPHINNKSLTLLQWQNLNISNKKNNKILIKNVSGQIQGGMTAIMGGSGSGKTTLMNALSKRLNPNIFKITGKRLINGKKYNKSLLKQISGYVLQDDIIFSNLSVYETLYYHSLLRNNNISNNNYNERIQYINELMGLTHIKDVLVGNSIKKGISGGERKRLCIGIELLGNPLILFLDEPTSGLDSFTSHSICICLKNLVNSETNCTVVSTIHQPSTKTYNLFDNLILLKNGNIIYQGQTKYILELFNSIGFFCPEYTNPAEHIIDVINKHKIEDITVNTYNNIKLIDNYNEVNFAIKSKVYWIRQFKILFLREFINNLRNYNGHIFNFLSSAIIGLIIGGIFDNIGNNQKSIQLRFSVLFFTLISQGINASLQGTHTFPLEREIILRERAAGCYNISAYFLSKTFNEIIFSIPLPIIFACSCYFLIGLRYPIYHFFIYSCFLILTHIASTSLAVCISTITKTINKAVSIMPFLFEMNRLFAGFFIQPNLTPNYFKWLQYLCYSTYGFIGASLNEFQDLKFICDSNELIKNDCPIKNGNQVLHLKGFDIFSVEKCFYGLLIYIFITKLLSYISLRFLIW